MKQENGEIVFTKSEFELSGMWSIPLTGVAGAVAELQRQKQGLIDGSMSPSPLNGETGHRYRMFQRALDMGRLADRLMEFVPSAGDEEFDAFMSNLDKD